MKALSGPSLAKQQGFGLLVFVLLLAAIAFFVVVAYAGILTRQVANELPRKKQEALLQAMEQVRGYWRANAINLDAPGSTLTAQALVDNAGLSLRYGMQAEVSNLLSKNGTTYRKVLLYSQATDDAAPLDLARFRTTGEINPCPIATDCGWHWAVFDSFNEIHQGYSSEALSRLRRVAFKAQAYFKARNLQDPERNISVNYFRSPSGNCVVLPQDLGCADTYTPLVELPQMVKNLGLSAEELYSPWGTPIEASNLQDSETTELPFTMAFRVRKPDGSYYTVKAVQQI
jgi:hypothetical protein